MTNDERNAKLEEVREAVAQATAGSWTWWKNDGSDFVDVGIEKGYGEIARLSTGYSHAFQDAHLIANAPAYLAFLLGEVERLSGECDLCPEMEAQVAYGLKLTKERAQAVKDEREACAKVAESLTRTDLECTGCDDHDYDESCEKCARLRAMVAEKIRARK